MNSEKKLTKTLGSYTPKKNDKNLIDWKDDFLYPKAEISFHIWENETAFSHYHNFYEFFIVTKGELKHTINSKTTQLSHGSICFITPDDRHSIQPLKNIVAQHLNLAITEEKLKYLCNAVSPAAFDVISKETTHFMLSESDLAYFLNKSDLLRFSYLNDNADMSNQFIIIEMLVSAISFLYRKSIKTDHQLPDWFNNLLFEIDKKNLATLRITDIYKLSNYSPAALLKYFKEYLGETINSYVTKLRINKACALLTNTNYTVIYIAEMVGYNALAHFNRTFKAQTGQTPKEYRKQNNK